MNLKAPLIIGCVTALLMPSTNAVAGGRHASSFSRPAGGRAAPQRAAFRGSAPAFRGPAAGFRGSSAGAIRRANPSWAGANRFAGVSPTNNWTRDTFASNQTTRSATNFNQFNSGTTRFNSGTTRFNSGTTRFNSGTTRFNGGTTRFNGGTTRFSNDWTTANRFRTGGFNRAGNWSHHHHHGCDTSSFFFSFGFPFFGAWDYGYYYPSAYYPYYPYTSYYYDPYTYYPGYSGYSGYVDPGYGGQYYDDGQNYDPGYGQNGRYHEPRQYDRSGGHDNSVVARVQEQLAHDGYYKGAIDGVAGSRTYYAIRAYQRDHNLPVDGEITDQLLGEMGLR